MPLSERETLLNTHLEAMSGVPTAIQYENEKFNPPGANEVYLQVFHMPLEPVTLTLSGSHVETALMQINILSPLGRHKREAAQLAGDIRSHFVWNTPFVGTGETTRIKRMPHVAAGYSTGERWLIPVTIRLETLPS